MSDTAVVFLLIPGVFLSILVFVGVGRRMDMHRVLAETDRAHTPPVVIGVLVVLTLICAILIGNGFPSTRKTAPPLHVYGFALVMSVTLYVIFDLDHPRVGLIRLDYADQAMTDLIAHIQAPPAVGAAPSR